MVYCALLMSYMALLMVDNALPQEESTAVRAVAVMMVIKVFFIFLMVLLVSVCYMMLSPSMYCDMNMCSPS